MKKICMLCVLMSLFLTACTDNSITSKEEKPLILPDSLKLTIELPSEYPEQVQTYKVDWLDVKEETMVQVLLKEEVEERIQWATGPQLQSEGEDFYEVLTLYDGDREGGFAYSYSKKNHPNKCDWVTNLWPGYPSYMTQVNRYNDRGDYTTEGDLSFKRQADASKEIEDLLYACGFPPIQLQQAYLLDSETMNEHLALYYKARSEWEEDNEDTQEHEFTEDGYEDTEEYEFTEEDECYLFHHRQVQDEIPFINLAWSQTMRDVTTETVMYSLYGKDGVLRIDASGFYEIKESLSTDSIINPEEAIAAYVEEYNKAIQFVETEIFEVELNYIVVYEAGAMFAKPAWIISTKYKVMGEDLNEVDEYEVAVVSAITGVLIQSEKDLR